MKRAIALWALGMLAGCAGPDEFIPTGDFESPCAEDPCNFDHTCLQVDGFAFCSTRCTTERACRQGYVCNTGQGVCAPVNDPNANLGEHRLCGEGFSTCRAGLGCADFGEFGERCAQTGCLNSPSFCWSNCCVPTAPGDTSGVCAPPGFCD